MKIRLSRYEDFTKFVIPMKAHYYFFCNECPIISCPLRDKCRQYLTDNIIENNTLPLTPLPRYSYEVCQHNSMLIENYPQTPIITLVDRFSQRELYSTFTENFRFS